MAKLFKFGKKIPLDEEAKNNSSSVIENKLDITTASDKSNKFSVVPLDNNIEDNNFHLENINHTNNKAQLSKNEKIPLTNTIIDEPPSPKTIFGNEISNEKPFRIGNMYCFLYYKGKPIFTIGAHLFQSLLFILFIHVTNVLTHIYAYKRIHFIFRYIGIIVSVIQNVFHLYTFIINQGIPDRKWFLSQEVIKKITHDKEFNQNFNFERYQICKVCNLLIDKELNVVHCCFCDVCCEKYDHHCPWLGKCIGKNNLKAFSYFILFTFIFFTYTLIVLTIAILKAYKIL